MKIVWILVIFTIGISCDHKKGLDNDHFSSNEERQSEVVDFEKKWGADEYGMKKFVMAFLRSGPNRDQDSTTAAQIQRGHRANIERLIDEEKLVVAGPFLDDFDMQGIFIFNVETLEEAQELTNTDPAIKAGRLIMELHPWYGSAALMELKDLNVKLEDQKKD